jgi:putative membrane protein
VVEPERLDGGLTGERGSGGRHDAVHEVSEYDDPVGVVIRVLVNTGAILLAAHLVPGLSVSSLTTALIAGLVLGIINAIVRPVLVFLTLPLTLLTLGLFLLVLNAFCLWLTSVFVPGFSVAGFWPAFLGALIVSVVSWILTAFLSDSGRVSYWRRA